MKSTMALPVDVLDSLVNLTTLVNNTPIGAEKTETPYDVPNLGMLGQQGGGDPNIEMSMAATFQAQPFAEPLTMKFYVRERWYDPQTGTWLTPDPLGYRDSSNLYAFAGGDPVSGRDPLGEQVRSDSKDLPPNFKVPDVPPNAADTDAPCKGAFADGVSDALRDTARSVQCCAGGVPRDSSSGVWWQPSRR